MGRWAAQNIISAPAFVSLALANALSEITVLMAERMQQEALTGSLLMRQEGFRNGIGLIRECLSESEYGIALEHLCYLVEEAALPISGETYMALAAAGDALQMHPLYWTQIKPDAASVMV